MTETPLSAFAERYGGAGLGPNGGGVRCLDIDGVQYKGIGANLLAGSTTDRWHRHGALSAQDAVREVIWGELFDRALPYGAVRALALTATGTQFAVEVGEAKAPGWASRAIVAREPVVRPAHFMRSIFFEPGADARLLPPDAQRTREACCLSHSALIDALKHRPWTVAATEAARPTLGECWREVWRRAAHQLAASRVSRLIHGSLTPSNYGVDGRWLDFSTCTAVSDHGRAIVAPGGVDMWRQETLVLEAMGDVAYYLGKYLPSADLASVNGAAWKSDFESTLRRQIKWFFARRSGVPESWLRLVADEVVGRFIEIAVRVALEGAKRPYLYFGGSAHAMPERTGCHDLAGAMKVLAWWPRRCPVPVSLLDQHIADQAVAVELADAYDALRESVENIAGSAAPEALMALAANTYRMNMSLQGLWRFPMDVAIDKMVREQPDRIGLFIDEFIDRWGPILQRLEKGPVSTSGWLTQDECFLSENLRIRPSALPSKDRDILSSISDQLTLTGAPRVRVKSFIESLRNENV